MEVVAEYDFRGEFEGAADDPTALRLADGIGDGVMESEADLLEVIPSDKDAEATIDQEAVAVNERVTVTVFTKEGETECDSDVESVFVTLRVKESVADLLSVTDSVIDLLGVMLPSFAGDTLSESDAELLAEIL